MNRLLLEKIARESLFWGGVCLAAFYCLGPLSNPDLPWHLAVGREIWTTGSFPRTDFLSWTMHGEPWVNFEWITQLLYYALDRAGGMAALWVLKCLQLFLLIPAWIALLRVWNFSRAWIGLSLPFFMFALFPFFDLRPEAFSMLFVLLQLLALERMRLGTWPISDRWTLAGHGAVYALWANLHPGFPVAAVLLFFYGAAAYWRTRENPTRIRYFRSLGAGLLGTCLNPHGPKLFLVFWQHGKDFHEIRKLIVEWGAPNFFNAYHDGYWMILFFSFAAFLFAAFRRKLPPPEHLAVFLVFALFSSRAFRTTQYAALVLFPLGLRAWHSVEAPYFWSRIRAVCLAAGLGFVLWKTGGFFREQRYLKRVTGVGRVAPQPVCDFLLGEKEALAGLKMFNSYNWGGFLDYALYPHFKVFMDGRYLFHGHLKEFDSVRKNPMRWRRYMEKYGVELALMENDGHRIRLGRAIFWRAFDAYAMPRKQWALVYWDSWGLVLVRRDKVDPGWLERHEYRFLRPRDLNHIGLRIVAGEILEKHVVEEIARYEREIGDPREVHALRKWFREFKKGIEAAR